jgi:peptide/nickel transport system permease protein
MGLVGLFGPFIVHYNAAAVFLADRLLPPGSLTSTGSVALFGTDGLGRDVLAQVVQGARISLLVAASTVLLASTAGTAIGVFAGYFGGVADTVLMRLADMQLSIPSLLLIVMLATVLSPGLVTIILTLALARWVVFARVSRAVALSTKSLPYVDSARVLGASHIRIALQHIMPAAITPLLVIATVELGLAIVAEASLSYLGLGVPLGTPSWGATIAVGQDNLTDAWWIVAAPGFALATTVVFIGRLGDAVRNSVGA